MLIGVRWIILTISLFLLFNGAVHSQEPTEKEYELITESEKGGQDKVLSLLNEGINPNVQDWYGMTPLHYATQNGHLKIVKILLLNKAEVDLKDYDERTALHLAVHFDHLDIAEYLVQHYADVNAKDIYGLSPLFYSCAYGDYLMTDMFLFYTEAEEVRDPEGRTPFLAAVWGGHLYTASLLLKYFSDVNEKDYDGNNAIHLAVLNRDIEMIDSLHSWGCNINAINKSNYSCLDVAIQENSYQVVEELIRLGANVNNTIRKGVNSLDLVLLFTKNQEIASLMENAGASRNKRISFSQPAVSLELNSSFQDVMSNLMLEIWEPKYGLGFKAGISQRLGRLKVITDPVDNMSYQFRETRTAFIAGAEKQIMLVRLARHKRIGMRIGIDAGYFTGNNKASENPPEKLWTAIPYTGLYYHAGPWQLGFRGLYLNLKTYQLPSIRMGLSITRRFNELK